MSDYGSCPFCGRGVNQIGHHAQGQSHENQCPLGGYTFTLQQWAMRPPKEEQPAKEEIAATDALLYHMSSQIGWFQSLVEKLTIYTVGLDYSKKESDYTKPEKEDK